MTSTYFLFFPSKVTESSILCILFFKLIIEFYLGIFVVMQEPTVASPIADLPEKISVITDEPVKEHHKLEYSSQQKQPSDNSVSFFFCKDA